MSQSVLKGIRKIGDWYLHIEFALLNWHHRKNRFLLSTLLLKSLQVT